MSWKNIKQHSLTDFLNVHGSQESDKLLAIAPSKIKTDEQVDAVIEESLDLYFV